MRVLLLLQFNNMINIFRQGWEEFRNSKLLLLILIMTIATDLERGGGFLQQETETDSKLYTEMGGGREIQSCYHYYYLIFTDYTIHTFNAGVVSLRSKVVTIILHTNDAAINNTPQ